MYAIELTVHSGSHFQLKIDIRCIDIRMVWVHKTCRNVIMGCDELTEATLIEWMQGIMFGFGTYGINMPDSWPHVDQRDA